MNIPKRIKTKIGRLRILGYLEGTSLLLLIFIGMPLKYLYADPSWVSALGPIHGALFLLFVLNAFGTAIEQRWQAKTTGLIVLSCLIPFGTFYVNHRFLKQRDHETA